MVGQFNLGTNYRSNTILSGVALISSPLVFYLYAYLLRMGVGLTADTEIESG